MIDTDLVEMATKVECKPRTFEEFNFEELLSQYGPEGLWELSEKLREVAMNDVRAACEIELTI